MGIKDFVDNHPGSVIVGILIGTVSSTAAVMDILCQQRLDNEKTKIETEYQSQVTALKTRLASIERGIDPGEEDSYFDVAQLIVTPDRIKVLDASYKAIGDGNFFIIEPSTSKWTYSFISSLEFNKLMLGDADPPVELSAITDFLAKKTIHIWKSPNPIVVYPRLNGENEQVAPELSLYPMVSVEPISYDFLHAAFSKLMDEKREKDLSSTLKKMNELSKELTILSSEIEIPRKQQAASTDSDRLANKASMKLDMEEQLRQVFRGDVAAVFLMGTMMQTLAFSQRFAQSQTELKTVQKKGNVVYLQARNSFEKIKIEGKESEMGLFIDREVFLVTGARGLFLVTVQIPTLDGRSEAYPWVAQWLSGLRLPI
jgi:hypothetical protein